MNRYFTIASILSLLATGCTTAPESHVERRQLIDETTAALKQAKETDESLDKFLQDSAGYAIFPRVDKGAAIVGGSYGHGTVHNGDQLIGYADITQATVGLQAGGEQFSEIVVFENPAELLAFEAGKLTLAANVSAVALKTGTAESAKYTDGVAVFVRPIDGLMVEAAVGGQQFAYQPK